MAELKIHQMYLRELSLHKFYVVTIYTTETRITVLKVFFINVGVKSQLQNNTKVTQKFAIIFNGMLKILLGDSNK